MKGRKIFLSFLAVVLIFTLIGSCLIIHAAKEESQTYAPVGYINVVAMGAIADDGKDDTRAFINAFATGMPVYVPQGEFIVSQPLRTTSQLLVGAGAEKSRIIAKIEDTKQPIMYPGNGGSYIRDITLGYADGYVTGNEDVGERVGMYTGNTWAFGMGTSLRNVIFENVGTAVYSLDGDQYAMFSATFENVTVKDFSFRGFDIRGLIRTGNYWRNIYMTSKYTVDSALYLDGEESETVFTGIVVENLKAREPIHLLGLRGLKMSGISLRNVELRDDESGYIYLDNTNGTIDSIHIENGKVKNYCSLFKLGRGDFYVNHGKGVETSYITVNVLNVENLHNGNIADKNFTFASRSLDIGDYSLEIKNYLYSTKNSDDAKYKAFAKDSDTILLTLMGKEQ